ncbi:cell wall integrity and stress response component 1-like [Anopheles arabiensis]|uniref:Uncharacterized protein n=1 Tax=Anopheles arabiensis TaxID=7173 RepID=A0A182HS71_ANOAR|nr:cell wall integrity and stress response component 1-like [Anopheles arabiensis]
MLPLSQVFTRSVWCVVGMAFVTLGALDVREGSSCTQLDFDEATVSSLRKCEYMQEFVAKRYDESDHFEPYRSDAVYYLSHRWQGLTCGETVNTYAFNAETELRMAYNLVFDSGAMLEVRVYDEEHTDPDNKPTLVEYWSTKVSTDGWGYFREKLNKTVKQARIQIEANINAGSDLAIEYLTIFNYEVETEECSTIDEFSTTTGVPSSTTSTMPDTTTTQQPDTTTPVQTTTSAALSTDDVEAATTTTTEVSEELTTSSLEQTTTTTVATTTTTTVEPTTTTTNNPRDDSSLQPTSSTTEQHDSNSPTTSSAQTTGSTTTTTYFATTQNPPASYETISPKQWLWITLTALFAVLFVLAASAALYLCFMNQHLERISNRLLDEMGRHPYKK